MKRNPKLPKPPKVGEIVKDKHGMELMVMSVSHGPLCYGTKLSAEPIAKKKGFITMDQIIGFRAEHYAPPIVSHGTRRDPATLTDADWNFVELMKRPVEEKKVALFHELARESARVREACRPLEAGAGITKGWDDESEDAYEEEIAAQDEVKRITEEHHLQMALKKEEPNASESETIKAPKSSKTEARMQSRANVNTPHGAV